MTNWTKTARRALLAGVAAIGFGAPAAYAAPYYYLDTTIPIPASTDNSVGGKFATYDIADVDPVTNLVYLGDRSNASVDVFNALTNTYVTRIGGTGQLFSGQQGSNNGISGPDGVLVARSATVSTVYAGNGNSTLLGFNLNGYAKTSSTATGGTTRVDELAFDPTRNYVIAVNNAETPPFLSIINATNGSIVKQITFNGTNGTPNATTGGLEAPVWDPVTGKYYVSVPQIGTSGPGGVSEIDPNTMTVTRTFDLATALGANGVCSPSGIVAGAGGNLLVACGANGASSTILLNPNGTGTIKVVNGVGGEDQVAYDPTNQLYFAAARYNPGGPVLGIIDANGNLVADLATTVGDHSVTVDPNNGEVFVAFGADPSNTICPNGCMAVFAVPEPGSLPLFVTAALGMVGLVGWRMRKES